jgi:hypothetical protein
VVVAGLTSATDAHPDLASPYQPYELKLSSFYPAPNRRAGVLLRVSINGGQPLRMLLDSGAEFIVIGAKTARPLGLSSGSEMDLVGLGTRPARVGMAEIVHVGPVSFRNCRVALVEGQVVEGADGVIPLSLFSDFLLRLDPSEKTLGLIPYPREESLPVSPTRGIRKRDVLLVAAVLNGQRNGYVLVDTGAFCSAISRDVARTLSGFQIVPEVRLTAGTGAAIGQRISSTAHFVIAEQDLIADEVVALDLSDLSLHYGVEVIGVLGFPALARYVMTIDYRNGRVKIEPPQTVSARELNRGRNAKPRAPLAFR